MVILFKGYNNHSNRLLQTIHLEAFCIENNLSYYNPSFWKMAGWYRLDDTPNTHTHTHLRNILVDRIIWSLLCSLNKVRLLNKLKFSDEKRHAEYSNKLCRTKLIFVHGWYFRNFDLTEKYQKQLAAKYSLLPEYYKDNDFYKQISEINRNEFNLVGVHIRRGDYKEWQNGAYYFSDDVYLAYMNKLEAELNAHSGKKTLFIIFSNEKVSLRKSENLIFSNNPWYVDQHIMSMCDYLIGPPSTFTLWASYVGKVNYFHLKNESGEIAIDDFVKCVG